MPVWNKESITRLFNDLRSANLLDIEDDAEFENYLANIIEHIKK